MVVTTNLCPLSFPSNNPHVSRFIAVFTFAMARKRGRHSRGTLTVFRSGTASLRGLGARVMRSGSERLGAGALGTGAPWEGAGTGGAGTGGAGRAGPGY